jgi:hypothetical protein
VGAACSLSQCSTHPEEIAAKARRSGRNSTPCPGLTTGADATPGSRLASPASSWLAGDTVSDPACHGACSKSQAPRHASALERRDAFEEGARLALATYGTDTTALAASLQRLLESPAATLRARRDKLTPAVAHRARIRRCRLRLEGVEQQDAADEAGASHGASLLILVFYAPRGDRGESSSARTKPTVSGTHDRR